MQKAYLQITLESSRDGKLLEQMVGINQKPVLESKVLNKVN